MPRQPRDQRIASRFATYHIWIASRLAGGKSLRQNVLKAECEKRDIQINPTMDRADLRR